jgi:hypothetical protein
VQPAEALLLLAILPVELHAPFGVEQVGDHPHHARRVDDVDDGLSVLGRDPHRGVLA